MDIFIDALPEFLGALGSAAVVGTVVWCFRAWRRQQARVCAAAASPPTGIEGLVTDQPGTPETKYAKLRRYTLLRTTSSDGSPIQLASTRQPGTLITWTVRGRTERFELTDVRLYDGTFAAEPLDRYETAP